MTTWKYHSSQISCRDGSDNVYPTVKIGNQEWMAENLKTTKYNDGTNITFVDDEDADANVWENLTTGAYSQGGSGSTADDDYEDTYGFLYNWYAVDTDNLAPVGWHVPTDVDMKELELYLGMSQAEADDTGHRGTNEGCKLAGNADLWTNGTLDSNSEFGISGFNLLPGGYRSGSSGNYAGVSLHGYFWSSTGNGSANAWSRILSYNRSTTTRSTTIKKETGYSIRFISDSTVSVWNTLKGGVWNLGSFVDWEDLDKHNWEDWN